MCVLEVLRALICATGFSGQIQHILLFLYCWCLLVCMATLPLLLQLHTREVN